MEMQKLLIRTFRFSPTQFTLMLHQYHWMKAVSISMAKLRGKLTPSCARRFAVKIGYAMV